MELLKKHAKKHIEKVKFGIVGAANTALDFAILFLLVSFGLDKIVANFFSTGIAFFFSFFVRLFFFLAAISYFSTSPISPST